MNENQDATGRLRSMWALRVIESLRVTELGDLLVDCDPVMRAWAYRLGAEIGDRSSPFALKMSLSIPDERSPSVLAAASSALQHLEPESAGLVAGTLVMHSAVTEDPGLSALLWYGIERWFRAAPDDALRVLPRMKNRLVRENTVRFLLAQSKWTDHLEGLTKLLAKDLDGPAQLDLLRGIRDALAGRKAVSPPQDWAYAYALVRNSPSVPVRREAEALAVLFGDNDAIAELNRRIADTNAAPDDRRAAIELLLISKQPEFVKTLHRLLDEPAVRQVAIRGLAVFSDSETPSAIFRAYPQFTPDEKLDAVHALASRSAWANALLDTIEKGTIPRSDVPVTTARQILALNDKALSARLEKVWGKITPASKGRAALTKKWKEILIDGTLATGDVAHGRAIYTKHCASCHKMFGEGQTVGPELTGSQRANLDYVLENVLDPSAVVPNEYRLINFTMADERLVSGIVVRETKDAVTVRTTNDTVILPTADIATRKQTNVSIMPDGLFDQLKPDEVRDLVAYLRSKEQVPLPK
jgi:putative heme-binding domain-containing protein